MFLKINAMVLNFFIVRAFNFLKIEPTRKLISCGRWIRSLNSTVPLKVMMTERLSGVSFAHKISASSRAPPLRIKLMRALGHRRHELN